MKMQKLDVTVVVVVAVTIDVSVILTVHLTRHESTHARHSYKTYATTGERSCKIPGGYQKHVAEKNNFKIDVNCLRLMMMNIDPV